METVEKDTLFSEIGDWEEKHYYVVDETLFSAKTRFQEVNIHQTRAYGKMLVIDGRVQSAEEDEYMYHESLVHPALTAHSEPRSVLILGGGEGATLREVLRHPSIERVVMVDIDQEVVEHCIELLPEWHEGAFSDPRVEVVYTDGKEFVEKARERFDCIIIDVCDALEDTPALALYTEGFYRLVRRRLTPGGLLIVQAMELSAMEHEDHLEVRRTMGRVFPGICSYCTYVPSFWSSWGFVVAGDAVALAGMNPAEIDRRLAVRGLSSSLRYYDGETHRHMFSLSKDVRQLLAAEKQAGADAD